jgi:lysophospholipase L1-like esterase
MRLIFFALLLSFTTMACAAESKLKPGDRILFLGDSITAGGAGPNGWIGLVDEALKAMHPDGNYTVESLGYMGISVPGWIRVEEKSRTESVLTPGQVTPQTKDAKQVLGKHADVVVCMLGMNDSIHSRMRAEADYAQWLPRFEQLLTALKARLTPRVVGVATPTMHTEDPSAMPNVILREMHTRLYQLAAKGDVIVLPTHETMADLLLEGRDRDPDFRVTRDMVHPNSAGQLPIAIGMLKGLGEDQAAAWLRGKYASGLWPSANAKPLAGWAEALPGPANAERIRYRVRYGLRSAPKGKESEVIVKLPAGWQEISSTRQRHQDDFLSGEFVVEGIPDRLVTNLFLESGGQRAQVDIPAPWLIGVAMEPSGNWEMQKYTTETGKPGIRSFYNVEKRKFPWDESLAKGRGFGTLAELEPGAPLMWCLHTPRLGLVGASAPGAVAMAGLPFREGSVAYGARRIHSEKKQILRLEMMSAQALCHLSVWLNGDNLFQNRVAEANVTARAEAVLRPGWNALVFKCNWPFNPALNHHLSMWNFSVNLLGEDLDSLRISTDPKAFQEEMD